MRISNVDILGVVASVPSQIVDNRESLAQLYGDKVEAVIRATGIESRAIAPPGVTSLDLNCQAAADLIELTGTSRREIGGVVSVGFTPSYRLPGDAPAAQEMLGLRNNLISLDINMACSGYPHGATVAGHLASSMQAPILLLVGDVQSPYVSPYDKSTFPLMADVGTATLVTPTSSANEWIFGHYTDGSGIGSLYIPAGSGRNPYEGSHLEYEDSADGSRRRPIDITMNGFDVFRFVAKDVSQFLSDFMQINSIDPENLGAFVPHQPNLFMIDQLAKKLEIPQEAIWKSAHRYGNPASASIPLTLAHVGRDFHFESEELSMLLAGFGAGLSIGAWALDISHSTKFQVSTYVS